MLSLSDPNTRNYFYMISKFATMIFISFALLSGLTPKKIECRRNENHYTHRSVENLPVNVSQIFIETYCLSNGLYTCPPRETGKQIKSLLI